jgi:recombination protein RecT
VTVALATLKDRVRAATQQEAPGTAGRPAPASSEAPAGAPATLEEAAAGDVRQDEVDAVHTWLSRYEEHVTAALPAHMDAGRFLAVLRTVLPELRSCNPASVLQATITCARFGLLPDGREAVITAEHGRATFIPTYRGYIALMDRTDRVASVRVGMVHEADEYAFEGSAPPPLDFTHRHDPALTDEQRGEPLFSYAFVWFKDGHRSQVVTVNREQMEEIRNTYSRSYQEAEANGRRDSFWHTRRPDMWRKTAIRQLEKTVPVSAEFRALVETDQAGEEGRVQILHAPDPEAAALEAEAEAAAVASEDSQEEESSALTRKGSPRRRVQPRRTTRRERRAKAGRRA